MKAVRWWLGLSLVGLVPCACGDSFSTAGDNGPSLSDVPWMYADGLCKAVASCSPQFREIFFGPNDCKTLLKKRIEQASLPLFKAAVKNGTMQFDGSKLPACLKKLEESGCAALDNQYFSQCEDALGGTIEEGRKCAFDGQCEGNLYCQYDGSCPGTCTTRELTGGPCRDDNACPPGNKCFLGRCTEKLAAGATCSAATVECKSGLMCGPDTGSGRNCVALDTVFTKARGQSCDIAALDWCQAESYCAVTAVGLGTSTQTCVEQAESGRSCNFSVADMCPKDQYCEGTAIAGGAVPVIEGACHLLPMEDQPCTNKADLGKACAAEHVCVTREGGNVCRKLRHNDEPCTVDAECFSESCQGGICAPKTDCDVGSEG